MLEVQWKGGLAFDGVSDDNVRLSMDVRGDDGSTPAGPSPLETLLCSAAACSAVDIVLILQKKRQTISSYRIEIEWQRGPEGVYPRPITAIQYKHILSGPDLDEQSVRQAVLLSDEKYCSVIATLRTEVQVNSSFEIIQ